jgi:cytochrome P450
VNDIDEDLADALRHYDHNALATREPSGPMYDLIQARCPVFKSEARGGFWAVAGFESLRKVARDASTFVSGQGAMIPRMGTGRPLIPMEADPPDHLRYRELLMPRLGPAVVKELEPMVRVVAREILSRALLTERADLYETYAKQLPMHVITRLLGIEESIEFWEWTETLIYGRLEDGRLGDGRSVDVAAAAAGMFSFFEAVLEKRRRGGDTRDDLVGFLLQAERDGTLVATETLELCFFLLIAGLDNTAFSIRASLWHLAAHPEDRSTLIEVPSLIRRAVEEFLRIYAPVPGLSRTAVEETELEGQSVAAGDRVLLAFAAANRDAQVFDDPHHFRLDRPSNPHLAFGVGPHRCIGSHLARLELRVAIEEVLGAVPDYSLVHPERANWYPAEELVVTFGPSASQR